MNAYQIASLPYFGYPDVPSDTYHGTKALILRDKSGGWFIVNCADERTIADAIQQGAQLKGIGIVLDYDTTPQDYKDWRAVVVFTDGSGTS